MYGYGGVMTALEWLHHLGGKGVNSLTPEDKAELTSAGIINMKGEVDAIKLEFAFQFSQSSHVFCDTVANQVLPETETETIEDKGLFFAHAAKEDDTFGTGIAHRFRH